MSAPEPDTARYVYGVIPASPDGGWGADPDAGADALAAPAGIGGRPVHGVTVGSVTALCSPVDGRPVRPSRANITAHQYVVESAHAAGPVLPVRFGSVLPDEQTVMAEMLAPAERQLRDGLRRVEGHDEFRVRATYRPDVALSEVLRSDRRVVRLRDHLRNRPGGGTTGDRIELGELVAAGLERLREADEDDFRSRVARFSTAVADLGSRSDEEAVHSAILVDRAEQARLDAGLAGWAERQIDRLTVSVVGPLPPWDFTDQLTADRLPTGELIPVGRGPWGS